MLSEDTEIEASRKNFQRKSNEDLVVWKTLRAMGRVGKGSPSSIENIENCKEMKTSGNDVNFMFSLVRKSGYYAERIIVLM